MRQAKRSIAIAGFLVSAGLAAGAQQAATKPVQVMVVGMFHLANPGHDLHNVHVDDVLQPARQKEIAAVADGLNGFHPTAVMVEWPASLVEERYPKYLAGTLPPSRNEVTQLGFRLTRLAGARGVYGIDANGDFPFGPVQQYAQTHGQAALLEAENSKVERSVAEIQTTLRERGIAATLQLLNDPAHVRADQGFYRDLLKIGDGTTQPGADLVASWYKRNLLICANLVQLAKPGDRIVVFYGSGHAFLLRQCVAETPGFELVEPAGFLPK